MLTSGPLLVKDSAVDENDKVRDKHALAAEVRQRDGRLQVHPPHERDLCAEQGHDEERVESLLAQVRDKVVEEPHLDQEGYGPQAPSDALHVGEPRGHAECEKAIVHLIAGRKIELFGTL